MKNNITVADTATVSVLNGGTELADKDAVAAGMTLRITAEDGTTNDYTIGQKNTYNWTLDYVNGQQGNVWFGQMKNGTGSWANMTEVDRDGWPNWCVNTYYGPGIDGQQVLCQRLTQLYTDYFPHRRIQVSQPQWHTEYRRAEPYLSI